MWRLAELALFAFGLWSVAFLPVSYAGGGADDALFVRLAGSLLDGHWLGPFDDYTLIKGPFYPMFLAAAAVLHLPPRLATQGVVLSAGLLASHAAARLIGWRPAATLCFALQVANPAPLDRIASLLLREPLYAGLILLVLALAGRLWLLPGRRPLIVGASLGLALASLVATREEAILLAPSLLLMAGWRVARDRLRAWPLLVAPALACLLPLLVVAALNRAEYGVFRITDAGAPPLIGAYGALARIAHRERADVPIPRDAFTQAYRVSEAARRLQPDLEGQGRRFWTAASCAGQPASCDDIRAGWIMWALRGAATQAGVYHDARQADRFWRSLARELDAACDAKLLTCTPRHLSVLPPIHLRYLPEIARDTWLVARDTALLGPTTPGIIPSLVPPSSFAFYRRVLPDTPRSPSAASGDIVLPLPRHRLIGEALARLTPVLTVPALPLAFAWTAWRLVRDRFRPSASTTYALAIALALGARTLFLGLAAATLVPMQFRYLSPGFPLVLLMVGEALSSGAVAWGARPRR